MKCWGYNDDGQLGDGTTIDRHMPVSVTGLGDILVATQISAGLYHTCAVFSNGEARCWGYNNFGQLGDGTTTSRSTPVLVAHSPFSQIDSGQYHTCGITDWNYAMCWGTNDHGQLGDGTTTNRTTPVLVNGPLESSQISVGATFTCSHKSTGTAQCWGLNNRGQLGDGTTTTRTSPSNVFGLSTVTEIIAGEGAACARKSDKTASCWGNNEYGELGDGTTTSRTTPVSVIGLTNQLFRELFLIPVHLDPTPQYTAGEKTTMENWAMAQQPIEAGLFFLLSPDFLSYLMMFRKFNGACSKKLTYLINKCIISSNYTPECIFMNYVTFGIFGGNYNCCAFFPGHDGLFTKKLILPKICNGFLFCPLISLPSCFLSP
ncbi:MAG: hypothetical protein JXR95_13875 [Deltaproteobacteria bacterium]|nr:hypothetical protein [Deltaproteobacteria bacterium]